MAHTYALAFAAFALCATGANATCADTATPLGCAKAYSPSSGSTDPIVRCAAMTTYSTCAHNWMATCIAPERATLILPIAEARNTAAAAACASVCKGQPICAAAEKYWDSSAWSGSSSDSLVSKPSASLVSGSLNAGAGDAMIPSASDSSGSGQFSGSTASGSFGFYLQIWQWILLATCLGGILVFLVASMLMGKKRAKKSKKKAAPAPAEQPLPELAPLQMLEVPMSSFPLMQPYQMAAPVQYAPSYAPAPAMYAQPQYTTAAPQYGTASMYAGAPQYTTAAAPQYTTGYNPGTLQGYQAVPSPYAGSVI